MEPEVVAYSIKEMKEDIKELKTDIKALMLFMAVEQDKLKRNNMYITAVLSLVVSLVTVGVSMAVARN